eukprot:jgi/Tetstr1/424451/TSEL_014981.t1
MWTFRMRSTVDYAPVRPCRWSSDGFWVTCGCNKARPCAVVSWLMKAAGMQVDIDTTEEAARGGHMLLMKKMIAMGPDA